MPRYLLLLACLCLSAHGKDYPCTVEAGRYFFYNDPEWKMLMLVHEEDGTVVPNWRECRLEVGVVFSFPVVEVSPPQKPPFSFDVGKHDLSPAAKQALAPVVKFFGSHPEIEIMRVEGHADLTETPTPEAALALSVRRAEAVRDYLVAQGVEARRMETVGYGATRPVMEGSTPEALAMNRRVDFTVVKRTDTKNVQP